MNSVDGEFRGCYADSCLLAGWFTFIVDKVITINVAVFSNESLHCVRVCVLGGYLQSSGRSSADIGGGGG